jgi:hypothetical protein
LYVCSYAERTRASWFAHTQSTDGSRMELKRASSLDANATSLNVPQAYDPPLVKLRAMSWDQSTTAGPSPADDAFADGLGDIELGITSSENASGATGSDETEPEADPDVHRYSTFRDVYRTASCPISAL